MSSFKGVHFPKDVILFAAFFYVRYVDSSWRMDEIPIKVKGE